VIAVHARSAIAARIVDASRCCATCRHFRTDPRALEAAIPGLTTMGSGHASVRSDDGLCDRHDRYLPAASCCAGFEPV
jgi:hypothetical protein